MLRKFRISGPPLLKQPSFDGSILLLIFTLLLRFGNCNCSLLILGWLKIGNSPLFGVELSGKILVDYGFVVGELPTAVARIFCSSEYLSNPSSGSNSGCILLHSLWNCSRLPTVGFLFTSPSYLGLSFSFLGSRLLLLLLPRYG